MWIPIYFSGSGKEDNKESKVKAQKIRNIMVNHLRKGFRLRLKSNFQRKEIKTMRQLRKCPVKMMVGRAVAVESTKSYTNKEKEQIDDGSYQINKMNQELIIRNLKNKIKKALSRMGIKKLSDQNKYLIRSPMMASCSLRIKVHKEGCPGRLVVNQIGDPTYKTCKVLTDILTRWMNKQINF